jgi:membrane protein
LLVSFVLTTVIDELVAMLQGTSPEGPALAVGIVLNYLAAFVVATLLFAAMYKVLPDAKMAWKDAFVGACLTALLFVIGKALIGWYLQNTDLASGWGSAAASMIGVLVWMYYSSLILLFGAELTQVWASDYGRGIEPAPGAVPAQAAG